MFDRQTSLAIVFCGLLFVWAARVGADERPRASQPAPTKDGITEMLENKMVAAAREAYEQSTAGYVDGSAQDLEEPYRWSRRWLDAETALSLLPEGRTAAAEAHAKRMSALQEAVDARSKAGSATAASAAAMKYYRVEAELLTRRAREDCAPVGPQLYVVPQPLSPYAPGNPYVPHSPDGQYRQFAPPVPDGTLYGGARIILLSVGRTY